MVKQMVFQSYGVEKYNESYDKSSTTYLFRVNKYKPAEMGKSNVATTAIHTDKSFFTILSQNHVNGLQIQTKDDEWITVEFLPSSFVVMASNVFMVTLKYYLLCSFEIYEQNKFLKVKLVTSIL